MSVSSIDLSIISLIFSSALAGFATIWGIKNAISLIKA